MRASGITVRIYAPWWTSAYVYSCGIFARLHGLEPDLEKISATISKHIKVEVIK